MGIYKRDSNCYAPISLSGRLIHLYTGFLKRYTLHLEGKLVDINVYLFVCARVSVILFHLERLENFLFFYVGKCVRRIALAKPFIFIRAFANLLVKKCIAATHFLCSKMRV